MATACCRIFKTPAGRFALLQHDSGELEAKWLDGIDALPRGAQHDPRLLPGLSRRLERYFEGKPVDFSDVRTPEGPRFFRQCWEACRRVRRGTTLSYADLARRAESSGAARAAGQAMRRNRLAVIIPCHRIVATGGGLHGYAGSLDVDGRALRIKRYLLALEGA